MTMTGETMGESAASEKAPGTRWKGWGGIALSFGGLGAAFAAAACCALPILLGSVGIGTSRLFGIGALAAPHRLGLLTIALIALAGGAWALWRHSRVACAPGAWCSRRSARVMTAASLVLGVVLAVLGYRYG